MKKPTANKREIRKNKIRLIFCNTKIVLWFVYGLFQLLVFPMVYGIHFQNSVLLSLPLLPIMYAGFYTLSMSNNPINAKIKEAEKQKIEVYNKIHEIQSDMESEE